MEKNWAIEISKNKISVVITINTHVLIIRAIEMTFVAYF